MTGFTRASEDVPPPVELGVIGGSGLYALLDDARETHVETPYGPPSAPLMIGSVGGRRVAFLPRHGRDHRFPPHRVPYRANLWALRSVGVRQVLAASAVGGLTTRHAPGSVVVPDQLVDRTRRSQTFHDERGVHVAFADPYCADGRAAVLATAGRTGVEVVDGGTLVVVEGPRYSSRAESQWYAAQGWTLIGMTALPEASLARELAVCYTTVALVTDLDAGVDAGTGVTHAEVLETFATHLPRVRELVLASLAALPAERDCACSHALDGLETALDPA